MINCQFKVLVTSAVICGTLISGAAVADKVKEVIVQNVPLPVVVENPQAEVNITGSVDVSGSNVNATLTGVPDVNVINAPDVTVANVPDVVIANAQSDPIPVTDQGAGPQPAILREQFVMTVPAGASNFSATFFAGASTPDRIRVVEHISVQFSLPAAVNITFFSCTLRDTSFNEIVGIPVLIEKQSDNSSLSTATVGNLPIRLYINDTERLSCSINLDAAVPSDRDTVISLLGYEVDRSRNSLAP